MAGWAFVVLFVALVIGWSYWKSRPENAPRPVAAHSTPLVQGRCAISLETGQVWGRIVRLGSVRGHMDRYVVETFAGKWRMTEVQVTSVRVVRCEGVTGPRKLDYGSRTP
jgi:hypothetical protein